MSATIDIFDHLPDGRAVSRLTLRGPRLSASLLTLGATVQDLRLAGAPHPLVLGFPTLAPYLGAGLYVGAMVGRFANRIGGGRFTLDGVEHQTDRNFLGRHLLHGGADGIHQHLWEVADLAEDRATLTLCLPDGHMGFPGTIRIGAEFSVAGDGLDITLSAATDAPTLCNLAHHGYFDLDGLGDIRGHRLRIAADHYLPVTPDLIPTGAVADVSGTPFDFRHGPLIGARIAEQGYDHNLCLAPARRPLTEVARLEGRSGPVLTIETTEPGLQLYDGRHFTGLPGLDGRTYGAHAGVALETQGWPDAPNHPHFPDTTLRPGQPWQSRTVYRFG